MPLPTAVTWFVRFARTALITLSVPLGPVRPGGFRPHAFIARLALVTLAALAALVAVPPGLAQAASAAPTLDSCSWNRPGANPFTGDVVAAVDRYTDIPLPVRNALKARIAKRKYDEVAAIGRDSISGKHRYSPEIRDMHFGAGQVCRSVTRSAWPATAQERGLVYCEQEHCVIVPTVCRNVSRVTRLAPVSAAGGGGAAGPAGADTAAAGPTGHETSAATPDSNELLFEAPGAGLSSPATESLPATISGPVQPLSLGLLNAPNAALPAGPETGATFESGATAAGPTAGAAGAGPGGTAALPWLAPTGGGLQVVPVTPTPAVPEPSSALMALAGLAGLAWARRRKQVCNTKGLTKHPLKDQ